MIKNKNDTQGMPYVPEIKKVLDMPETAKNLKRLSLELDTPPPVIRAALHLESVQSVYHWFYGQSMPTIDNLVMLSDLWDISIDKIICTKEAAL